MKLRLLIMLFFVLPLASIGQNTSVDSLDIGFSTLNQSYTVKDKPVIYAIKILNIDSDKLKTLSGLSDYTVKVSIFSDSTTLPHSAVILERESFTLKEISSKSDHNLYLTLKGDSVSDRERKLFLKIDISTKSDTNKVYYVKAAKSLMKIEIRPIEKPIEDYSVLAYLGSNFDMAEGKTSLTNLFFATNIFVPPLRERENKVGFYLSLYGNRTMTTVDSTRVIERVVNVQRASDSTYWQYKSKKKLKTTTISDNFGAHISPLIRLFCSKLKPSLNLYFSPSLEFVWRRTHVNYEFLSQGSLDSQLINSNVLPNLNLDENIRKNINEYAFNLGLIGLFLSYENSSISVRVHGSVGYSSFFYPSLSNEKLSDDGTLKMDMGRQCDIFFSGRAWITEPVTGITLQAEVTNTAFNPRPFFGATLSKAFKLKSLGGVLSPITSRN